MTVTFTYFIYIVHKCSRNAAAALSVSFSANANLNHRMLFSLASAFIHGRGASGSCGVDGILTSINMQMSAEMSFIDFFFFFGASAGNMQSLSMVSMIHALQVKIPTLTTFVPLLLRFFLFFFYTNALHEDCRCDYLRLF